MSEDPRNEQNQSSQGGQQLPPAGWYPDPSPQGTGERYWDGTGWTHDTRPGPGQAAPGPAAGQGAPAQPAPGQGQAQPGYGAQQPAYGAQQPGYGAQQPGRQPYGAYQNPWRSEAGFAYPDSHVTADGVRLGGWGARLVSIIIDNILLGIIQSIVLFVFFRPLLDAVMSWEQDLISAVSNGSTDYPLSPADPVYGVATLWFVYRVLNVLIAFAYFVLLMHFRGASIGQQAMGLRVVPAEQGRVPAGLAWAPACIRNGVWHGANLIGSLVTVLSFLTSLFLLVDIIYGLANKRRQTLHDKIARTQVISTRP